MEQGGAYIRSYYIMEPEFYAHSHPDFPNDLRKWQKLEDHLNAVAEKARDFAFVFNSGTGLGMLGGCMIWARRPTRFRNISFAVTDWMILTMMQMGANPITPVRGRLGKRINRENALAEFSPIIGKIGTKCAQNPRERNPGANPSGL